MTSDGGGDGDERWRMGEMAMVVVTTDERQCYHHCNSDSSSLVASSPPPPLIFFDFNLRRKKNIIEGGFLEKIRDKMILIKKKEIK